MLVAALFLSVVGIMAVASATLNEHVRFSSFAVRQTIFVLLGAGVVLLLSRLDYRQMIVWMPWIYGATIALLLLIFVLGQTIRGAQSWFTFGLVALQPAEFAKVAAILVLARYFSYYRFHFQSFRHVIRSFLLILPIIALIALQPDFGGAAMVLVVWAGLVLVTGIPRKALAILLLFVAIGGTLTWTVFLKPYQRQRITAFMNPTADPLGAGYNAIQAKIAVGSGGLWGKGLGQGSQSQLNFLPEQHTDFIFAVIGEELGFAGAALLLLALFILITDLFRIGRDAPDDFGMYVAIGSGILLLAQSTINIGMNMGIMPITGVTLPLVSYGGSSFLSTCLLLGLVQSIAIRGRITMHHAAVEPLT